MVSSETKTGEFQEWKRAEGQTDVVLRVSRPRHLWSAT